jgi:asparagine synthase (glutamine-hydrolysing)
MCGICGIALPRGSRRRLDAPLLVRMRDVLTHRGPDGSGLFLDEGIGLGHRRLSIIDPAAGQQPMASDDGQLQIVYNGEVYNHGDLRPELESQGHRFRTRCDTESVLRMYESVGRRVPERLRGMFAFAIWDGRRRELLLARDRLGVKPLYYVHTDDGALYFASEIKALIAAGAVRPELRRTSLPDYLANHATSGEETLFEGVRRLMPGHTLRWRDGAVSVERYWDLSFAPADHGDCSEDELVDEYRDRFRESVRMRLMSDVPLGMFLSGGIDSAAITAMMSTLVEEPIKTFSVAFAEREANELQYARLVANRYRTDHREVVVSPTAFFDALPRLVWHEDEPIAHPSSIALNFVSRLAAEHVKVVLTGEGSDESLAGYLRYRNSLFNLELARRYERAAPAGLRSLVRRGIDAVPMRTTVGRKLRRTCLYLPGDIDTLYFDNFAVFSRGRQRALLAPDALAALADVDPYVVPRGYLDRAGTGSMLHRFLYADTKTYLHELLMKQDQMSMAASIESRVPFLDHPLLEFAAGLPERLKLRGLTTKYILRRAMKDLLPAEILGRKKMGFPVPIGAWLRGEFRPLVDEYVLGPRALARGLFRADTLRGMARAHQSGEENHAQRLWSLINLEIWHRTFIDGEAQGRLAPALGRASEAVVA